ncbi:ADYC domain-containing protein [Nannocystis pusilla]|uniref:ADYC domain-containing protein n=1 Tax=Nannocystis pusilla TaxID=889268 RepID=UPI003BEFE74E
MQSFTRAIFILVALVGPACAPEDDLEFRTTLGGGGGSGGGTVFNTHALEKRRFSELTPAHEDSLGVALVDVELGDGAGVASFAVVDGALVVKDDRGEKREGAALVGSRWWVGNAFWLPQAPIEIAEVVEVDGVTHYVFVHQGDGGLVKNCVGATDGLVRVLSGVSLDEQTGDLTPSPATTFLACTNGAIGKAAAWGYYDLARALDDLEVFETAVRVVRADYCYDGESHTEAGVPLLVEDMWGVREPAAPGRPIEAVWGPHGLVCAGEPRQAGHGPIACDGVAVPACDGTLTKQVDAWFVTRLP